LQDLESEIAAKVEAQQDIVGTANSTIEQINKAVQALYIKAGIAEDLHTLFTERQRILETGRAQGESIGEEIRALQNVASYLSSRSEEAEVETDNPVDVIIGQKNLRASDASRGALVGDEDEGEEARF